MLENDKYYAGIHYIFLFSFTDKLTFKYYLLRLSNIPFLTPTPPQPFFYQPTISVSVEGMDDQKGPAGATRIPEEQPETCGEDPGLGQGLSDQKELQTANTGSSRGSG